MFNLEINEHYQEIVNNEGAIFFVESSDCIKFHIYDKQTNELIGKVLAETNGELSKKVEEVITFTL